MKITFSHLGEPTRTRKIYGADLKTMIDAPVDESRPTIKRELEIDIAVFEAFHGDALAKAAMVWAGYIHRPYLSRGYEFNIVGMGDGTYRVTVQGGDVRGCCVSNEVFGG